MAWTRFQKLPAELVLMIHEHLDEVSGLALDLYLNPDQNELEMVHNFLKKHMPLPVLAVQQIIHMTGARGGSYDWEQYSKCKTAIYRSPYYCASVVTEWEDIPLAIRFKDVEEALSVGYYIERMLPLFKEEFVKISPLAVVPDCFDKPNNIELARIVLAIYQFNAYCRLLGKDQHTMSFQQAGVLAKRFFQNLTPWEKEQMFCVAKHVHSVISLTKLELLRDDPDLLALEQQQEENMLPSDVIASQYLMEAYPPSSVPDGIYHRATSYLPTTASWKALFSEQSGTTEQRARSMKDLMATPVPWSVALEKWIVYEYEDEVEHPCATIFGLDSTTAHNKDPAAYRRLFNVEHDPDSVDLAPYLVWQVINEYMRAPYGVTTEYRLFMVNVGFLFWTEDRNALDVGHVGVTLAGSG